MEIQSQQDETKISQTNYDEDVNHVNLSNAGLTVVPVTLFKKLNITHLDLSDNNIKSLPPNISLLINLQYLNLCRNGFQCSSSEDTTVLPIGMKHLKVLKYLNISECNLIFVPATIWELTSLKQLDISRNNIRFLEPSIGNLDNLLWLNAQYTGLTTLPLEIVGCEKLETLLLYGNQIQTIPYLLAEIKNLKIFSVNLRSMATNIDTNMELLLHSGQIMSDHISNTIFNLPAVKRIELEYCKINYIKKFSSKALEELYIRGNFFRSIPDAVLSLKTLTELDLSKNLLVCIPDEVIELENIQTLMLQENRLESLSSCIFLMKSLAVLDISHNKIKEINIPYNCCNKCLKTFKTSHNDIIKIPEAIVHLQSLENLDISNNDIRELPINLSAMKNIQVVHSYNGLQKIGLWLLNNPIVFPPKNIWNTTDIQEIYQFLEKSKIQRLQNKIPVRIILLGHSNLQKQNFLDQLICKKSNNTQRFVSVKRWASANSVPFVLVNVDCHSVYSMCSRFFIENNCLIWIFINNEADDKLRQVEHWIKVIIHHSADSVIQIIVFDASQASVDLDNVNNEGEMMLMDGSDCDGDNYKGLIESLQSKYHNEKIKFLPDVLKYVPGDDLNAFKDKLEYLAIDEALFSNDPFVHELQTMVNSVEKLCKASPRIYINLSDLQLVADRELGIPSDTVCTCLTTLHKQGKLLWFSNNKKLSGRVYPFISVFNKSISSLLRPNYDEDLDLFKNPLLRAEGRINEDRLLEIKNNFFNFGEICYPLFKILTFDLNKLLEVKDFLTDAELAWTVPISSEQEESIFDRPYLVLPQFNKEKVNKTSFINNVVSYAEYQKINCALSIRCNSVSNCSHLFLNLRCAINNWAGRRFDWENLVYVNHDDGDILLFTDYSDDRQLNINVITRLWSENYVAHLPCGGDFKYWIENWLKEESENRNNFSYLIADIDCPSFDEYLSEFMNF